MGRAKKALVAQVSLIAFLITMSTARPVAQQSAYGDLGGSNTSLLYYAETYAEYMWNDARVEAWIIGDPAGAYVEQYSYWAWRTVQWDGDFCGDYRGKSNHWEIAGWQWISIYQGYTDDFTVWAC